MHIVTGYRRPKLTDYLPIFVCIQRAELHRQGANLSLAYRIVIDPNQLLHQLMVVSTPEQKGHYNLDTLLFLWHSSWSLNHRK